MFMRGATLVFVEGVAKHKQSRGSCFTTGTTQHQPPHTVRNSSAPKLLEAGVREESNMY